MSLLSTVPIGWFASSLPESHPILERATRAGIAMPCVAGQAWTWDGVRFFVLHPTKADYAEELRKTNDRSCVVRVQSAHGSALLTGDIEAVSEAQLVRDRASELRSDILLVPHHGSRTSSTRGFINAVSPAVALIGCGYRNRFNHPRPDIVARYANAGIAVRRTDYEGALTITVDGRASFDPVAARATRARYWLDVPVAEGAAPE